MKYNLENLKPDNKKSRGYNYGKLWEVLDYIYKYQTNKYHGDDATVVAGETLGYKTLGDFMRPPRTYSNRLVELVIDDYSKDIDDTLKEVVKGYMEYFNSLRNGDATLNQKDFGDILKGKVDAKFDLGLIKRKK